ncbi:MAG: alkaline phosphatase family protein [Frisingicoccus sp.]
MVHFTDVDSQKHDYGTESEEAWAAMERHSHRLMEIQDTLERLEMSEDTIFVLLGDHSQKDVSRIICLNALFLEKGWISIRRER